MTNKSQDFFHKTCCWIGIDPGLAGAIAVIDSKGIALLMHTPFRRSRGGVWSFHTAEVARLKRKISRYQQRICVIERISPFSGVSNLSLLQLGISYGGMFALASHIGASKVILPTPGTWKKAFGLSRDKSQSIELALKLYPEASAWLKSFASHNLAEAILLAHFGKTHSTTEVKHHVANRRRAQKTRKGQKDK